MNLAINVQAVIVNIQLSRHHGLPNYASLQPSILWFALELLEYWTLYKIGPQFRQHLIVHETNITGISIGPDITIDHTNTKRTPWSSNKVISNRTSLSSKWLIVTFWAAKFLVKLVCIFAPRVWIRVLTCANARTSLDPKNKRPRTLQIALIMCTLQLTLIMCTT